jgi:anti-sigma regulatory factor (Ser/Thr protein kinase)
MSGVSVNPGQDGPMPAEYGVDVVLARTFDASELAALRTAITDHSPQLGLDGDRAEDLVIVAHELALNAVRHGGGHGDLRLWAAERQVYCQVSDSGPGMADPQAAGRRRPDARTPGGRGLWLVRQLVRDLQIDSSARGTIATAVLDS